MEEKFLSTVAIKAMRKEDIIWKKYFNDFVYYYLHLNAAPDSLEYLLLQLTFTDILRDYNEKAVAAHCYLHLFQLSLAKLVILLRPLSQLQMHKLPEDAEDSLSTALEASLDNSNNSKFGSIVLKFLIGSLFEALTDIIKSNDCNYQLMSLQRWFIAYSDMVSHHNDSLCSYIFTMSYLVILNLTKYT